VRAMEWCTEPYVQPFPCCVFEFEVSPNQSIVKNKVTKGAYCIRVDEPKTVNKTDKLPRVRLTALLFAMPRGRLHAQHVVEIHQLYEATINYVYKTTPRKQPDSSQCRNKRYKYDGTPDKRQKTIRSWSYHLAEMTERRLSYWGLGGENVEMDRVVWSRASVFSSILILSLDCARCIRAAGGDLRTSYWRWSRVPPAWRTWLSLKGVSASAFRAGNRTDLPPFDEWSNFTKKKYAPDVEAQFTYATVVDHLCPAPTSSSPDIADAVLNRGEEALDEQDADWDKDSNEDEL
jgi:hypothetical protein